MARNRELNNYRIANPDGLSRRHDEYNRRTYQDRKPGAIREDSSRSFRELRRTPEYYRRRRSAKARRREKSESKSKSKSKRAASKAASLGTSVAAQGLIVVAAVVFCSFVYVSSLSIRVRPCSSMTDSLAFQTFFRNPDERPLRAALFSQSERYEKDFVGVAYLLFEGLEEKSEYELSIISVDTREEIYRSTFLTASEDPYQIRVEDPHITPDGAFAFGLQVSGLGAKDFYTVQIMDANGKTVAVLDGAEERTEFSIPISSLSAPETESEPGADANETPSGTEEPDETETPSETQNPDASETPSGTAEEVDADTLPFITVKINGRTFLPKVWNNDPEPLPESAPETAPDGIEWVWNEERTEAEALIPNPENPEEPERVAAEVTQTVAKEPQCEEPGLAVYTAVVPLPDGTSYQDVRTEVLPATGHRYERVSVSETGNRTAAEYLCPDCGKTYRVDASVTEETDEHREGEP